MRSYSRLVDKGKTWRIEVEANVSTEMQIPKEHLLELLEHDEITMSVDYYSLLSRQVRIAITGVKETTQNKAKGTVTSISKKKLDKAFSNFEKAMRDFELRTK